MLDADGPAALADGLVRSLHIDALNQLPQGVGPFMGIRKHSLVFRRVSFCFLSRMELAKVLKFAVQPVYSLRSGMLATELSDHLQGFSGRG